MKIEELSSDLTSSKIADDSQQSDLLTQALAAYEASGAFNTTQDGTTPSLPPGMAALQDKTLTEKLADLNKLPLFMTSLEENNDLEALKALAYEGPPLEISSGFKERGNASFATKGFKDAKEFYTKGIDVLLIEVRKRQKGEQTETSKADVVKEIRVLEACLVNRAACHLELKNYRSCVQDCVAATQINRRNVKAYYRGTKALLKLDKVGEADELCAKGLEVEPENKTLLGVAGEIIKRNELVREKKRKEVAREARRRKEEVTLKAALKAREIKVRRTEQPPEMDDAKIRLSPDPVDPTSSLEFPAVVLYPLRLESDFIKAWNEMEPLGHQLDYILPVPWDKEGEYTPKGVECYMETLTGGLLNVKRGATLLKMLSQANVEVVDEVVRVFVVPKAKAAGWVADFKEKKASKKTSG